MYEFGYHKMEIVNKDKKFRKKYGIWFAKLCRMMYY